MAVLIGARRRKDAVVVCPKLTLNRETWAVVCRMAKTAKHPYPGAVIAEIVEDTVGLLTKGAGTRNTQN